IDNLIQSCKYAWIHRWEIGNIEPTQIDNVYFATYDYNKTILVLLGNSKECTQTLVNELARIYSLPTHNYINDVNQFRRYKIWLKRRNELIKGFTEYDNNYYMVADKRFYHCYSRYG